MSPHIIELTDAQTGSRASILASQGFNCFRYRAMTPSGPIDAIWAPPGFESGTERPSRGGIPILFPFPGRIAGTALLWEGKQYPLEPGDALGNAIHGFVHTRPWRIEKQSPSSVTGVFQASVDDSSLAARWPSDFKITAQYKLHRNTLSLRLRVKNSGDEELPFGCGIHPYFAIPLGGTSGEQCVARVPVYGGWELKDMIVTGTPLPLGDRVALVQGMRLGDMRLDNVFTALLPRKGHPRAEIHDPHSGRTLVMTFDSSFEFIVVYNPPHRSAVCIEPYSCLPDAFRLDREWNWNEEPDEESASANWDDEDTDADDEENDAWRDELIDEDAYVECEDDDVGDWRDKPSPDWIDERKETGLGVLDPGLTFTANVEFRVE